jgi:predicted nicotinamide N-methyase
VVTVGDLFYERALAARVVDFLDRCLAAGMEVLVGDPGRAFLPGRRLQLLARYDVAGFGDPAQPPFGTSSVFSLRRDGEPRV